MCVGQSAVAMSLSFCEEEHELKGDVIPVLPAQHLRSSVQSPCKGKKRHVFLLGQLLLLQQQQQTFSLMSISHHTLAGFAVFDHYFVFKSVLKIS